MLGLIPVSDANPTRRRPYVTLLLIAVNVVAFFQTPGLGQTAASQEYFFENAPVPCQLEASCVFEGRPVPTEIIPPRGIGSFLLAILASTFLHAGFLHIIGNMLFLWVFGNNVEDFLGHGKFLGFYLLGGIAAAFAHILTHTGSIAPIVGASGAVAAVMGAYFVLYPRARVNVLIIFAFITIVQMSAWVVLALWFLLQFFIGRFELLGVDNVTSVAWLAHVGGFVFGVVAIYLLGGRPHKYGWTPETHWGRRSTWGRSGWR
ncbi:MAG TPA: rhomboid family intramembrane serine protease [Actinomycetota bacterium]|nr:rhomboid family intramembrane serine protease [Actinomycetota bacterium]